MVAHGTGGALSASVHALGKVFSHERWPKYLVTRAPQAGCACSTAHGALPLAGQRMIQKGTEASVYGTFRGHTRTKACACMGSPHKSGLHRASEQAALHSAAAMPLTRRPARALPTTVAEIGMEVNMARISD